MYSSPLVGRVQTEPYPGEQSSEVICSKLTYAIRVTRILLHSGIHMQRIEPAIKAKLCPFAFHVAEWTELGTY